MKDYFEKNFNFDLSSLDYTPYFEGIDVGEIFIEHVETYNVSMQNDVIKTCANLVNCGFGIRKCLDDKTVYSCNSDISNAVIKESLNDLYKFEMGATFPQNTIKQNNRLYTNSVDYQFEKFFPLLCSIRNFIKSKPFVEQSTISLSASVQRVLILLSDGNYVEDLRPLIKLGISVIVSKDGRQEVATDGFGGRVLFTEIESNWEVVAESAIRQAMNNISAISAPVGEMPVILGSGWTGVLLHEAIGHGLEADFNRKKTSVFTNLIVNKIASDKVTILDDGSIPNKRGSINFDDEGTPSQKTLLIENGILRSYMFDKQNAMLLGARSTGNGRRESFKHIPYPRMTNTYMLSGQSCLQEMIESVKHGIYAVSFSGGQVDITSGKFVFSASEAYLIENGKICNPIKGVTLIGDGASILQEVSMVADDSLLDSGVGTCGKNGQTVPVCVGQPSLKIDKITVGGIM